MNKPHRGNPPADGPAEPGADVRHRCRPLSLQEAVDALAARLARPAMIEDHQHRVMVHSAHDGNLDDVRRMSILNRRTDPEVMSRLQHFGIGRATGAVRTPAYPDLRMWPRLCVPVRHRGMLLGYVWFLDRDGTLTGADVTVAEEACGELTLEMFRELRTNDTAGHRVAAWVRDLLSTDRTAQVAAAAAFLDDGYFVDGTPVAVLIGQPVGARARPAELQVLLEEALVATARFGGPRGSLHLAQHDRAILVTAQCAGYPTVEETAARLRAEIARTTGEDGAVDDVLIGVGGPADALDDALSSYGRARLALRVAAVQPDLGPIARWADLGVYRALPAIMAARHGEISVHPQVERMFPDPAHGPMLETLETYLDLAGNADAAAKRLHLHRTSLYYRLQRAEQLLGADLKNGAERLCLHLALKVGRLSGAYRPGSVHFPRL
ncbi:transcriptional regulator [Pilimelia anulata]|uniref:Transcriptional regulator n=1 Tax=Pilimelia anulata TaxID=53371 RepID=A0A8J3F7N0_9ACTN|nr:helix-turn-helix domain-containing protein [Pilimelia anulata]GGJ78354.1 transcriptional regulator [Pilimelia anulata]